MHRAVVGTVLAKSDLTVGTAWAGHTEPGTEGRSRGPYILPLLLPRTESWGLPLDGLTKVPVWLHPHNVCMYPGFSLNPGAPTKQIPEAILSQMLVSFYKVHKDTYDSESRVPVSSLCP